MVAGYVAAARKTAPFLVASIGLLVLGVASTFFMKSDGFGYDYLAYDGAARRIAAGEPLYLPGTVAAYAEGRYEGLYLYPPPVAIALTPLTILTESAATLAWMLFRLALLVGGCLTLPVSWRARLGTLGVAGVSFPVLFDLNIGNVSIVVLALSVIAWRWMDRPAAALAHAALAVIRFPFLVFGVLFLIRGNWRVLGWTIAAGLALVAIAMPVVGVGTYVDYITILRGLPDITSGPHNLSFASTARELGLPEVLAVLGSLASYLIGLAAVVYAARRRDASTAFLVTALATLLVAPFIHPHYLVLLLLPAAWLMDRGHWWGIGLPLLGWLPDIVLPFAGPLAIALVLTLSADQGDQRRRASYATPP
jgi:hypothetical protein